MSESNSFSRLAFTLSLPVRASPFGPRLGSVSFARTSGTNLRSTIDTPGLLTGTSRGVVPHLSRDHLKPTRAIQVVHVPFESFLELSTPVLTLQTGIDPLHTFLGYQPSQHVLSMSLRDPHDGREMPPNGNHHITAHCVRGVRKVTPAEWRSYVLKCQPDLVVALSDTPFTRPPYSQKRLTKSIERSTTWLAHLLQPVEPSHVQSTEVPSGLSPAHVDDEKSNPLNVLVHMAGGISIPARTAFAQSLTETLHGKEAEKVKPLKCLDNGVIGYVFDLVPLRLSLSADARCGPPLSAPNVKFPVNFDPKPLSNADTPTRPRILTEEIVPLLKTSLAPLPATKLRLVNSAPSPHEMLRLIIQVGIDLFDVGWAQRAADVGVALDFRFPVPKGATDKDTTNAGKERKCNLGHNLYDPVYARDFSRLAACFLDGANADTNTDETAARGTPVCPCAACSPLAPTTCISHSTVDEPSAAKEKILPSYTLAYLHHLLHTHEMSSHSLLVMHNLAVLDAFFAGIRTVLMKDAQVDHTEDTASLSHFLTETERFVEEYDEELVVFDQAKVMWNEVDLARGKGRLARERDKRSEATQCDPDQ